MLEEEQVEFEDSFLAVFVAMCTSYDYCFGSYCLVLRTSSTEFDDSVGGGGFCCRMAQ